MSGSDHGEVTAVVETPAMRMARLDFDNEVKALIWAREVLRNAVSGQWKKIPGYDGYEASTSGFLRSRKKGSATVLSSSTNKDGYERAVLIAPDGSRRSVLVHRMVMLAFGIVRPSASHVARHLDGDRRNNRPDNLAWVTSAKRFRTKNQWWLTQAGHKALQRMRAATLTRLQGGVS